MAHQLVDLARKTIELYVRQRKVLDVSDVLDDEPKGLLATRAGAFVSLHRQGELRGCIGTIEPQQDNLALEIVSNAISAATRDPRFPPVQLNELDDLDISVDVLEPPERVASQEDLDPKVYGVIVEHGGRRGLLLPDLEGVDTAEQQVSIALRKGWIDPQENYRLYRFRVTRYH